MWKNFCSILTRMFDFSGREKRKGFWSAVAFVLFIFAALASVVGIMELIQHLSRRTFRIGGTELIVYGQAAFALVSLLLYFPLISAAVRRLHDVNASGFLLLVPLVNVILLSLPTSLKEKKESAGFRYWFGQFLILTAFIAASGFFALDFFGRKFTAAPSNEKAAVEEKSAKESAEKDTGKSESTGNHEKKESSAQQEKSSPHLLDAGVVTIPIHDKSKFNFIQTGSEELLDGTITTQYMHVQTLNIDFLSNTDIYDSFNSGTVIGHVNLGDEYTVLSLIQMTYPQENDFVGTFWIEIEYGDGSGYINAGRIDNPYRNDNYEPLEQIQIGEKIWTIRRFDSMFSLYNQIDIRDYPGLEGTNVIGKIKAGQNQMVMVKSDAITEQDESSEGSFYGEPWIRIEHEGVSGWIPGVYAEIERGSIKYQTPGGILEMDLGKGI
ncbi:MAG: DUF805 domain-containing protein [Treponema sp.]|nr:DUF805 domain-containing protein [Treponema sp.]MBQ5384190.1 DUF805 domain-containing protein [Treponema sp.]